jgi:hypothetical protein
VTRKRKFKSDAFEAIHSSVSGTGSRWEIVGQHTYYSNLWGSVSRPLISNRSNPHFSQSSRRLVATSPSVTEPWVPHTPDFLQEALDENRVCGFH